MTYREKLAMVRHADADHEAMMRDAAQKTGRNLTKIRRMKMIHKDEAISEMFDDLKIMTARDDAANKGSPQ